ncbi:lysine 5,6-aminomutase reactivase ATPase KamC [Haloplasma contractile]|uniref:DNA mismatch repair protein mutS n=1 Tax=Haloplasma contractile SSD-17B TaxID=1033810 RepID=F7Q0J0_9MOLU|nr:DNA mismatch repair protein MutS [Haloplasma contractile]ERJ12665.1 DNA mismatch repair protein mutS [Haloplasma contractile SSD-17B]
MEKTVQDKLKSTVGFKYVMSQLSIKSPYGIKHYRKVKPYSRDEDAKLSQELNRIQLFISLIRERKEDIKKVESLLIKFKDIEMTVINCQNGKTLDLVELYELKMQAIYMQEFYELINPLISFYEIRLNKTNTIIETLSNKPTEITYDFYLYERYSERLKMIREKKQAIEHHYYRISDPLEQERIKKLRSEYVRLEDEEELKVRRELTKQLSSTIKVIYANIKKVGHIDFLIAKARLATKYDSVRPVITDGEFILEDIVNPHIQDSVEENGGNYTKNSITLYEGTTVITGANMSGKSSILKTVALNAILAQLGFFVFAKVARIPLVDTILYVGSETESYNHGLSSFGFEIMTLNETIEVMKSKRCIVCIDEFARSTNPHEGQKFVKAYATYSNTFPSFTLFATHYDGIVDLDMNHYQIAGLKDELINSSSNTKTTLNTIHNYMDYSLKRVNDQREVPKEAYKVSLLLNIDEDFKGYLDKYYGE